jgi:hypothetical protein
MLSQTNPRLRRNNVMFNSLTSCVTDASGKFSRTPETSFGKILSQSSMSAQKFVDFASISSSIRIQNSFAVFSDAKKFHWVSGISGSPHKMENILSERMFSGLKFHFFAPAKLTKNTAHDNFAKFNSGGATAPSFHNNPTQLNIEDGSYSLGLNAEISLPLM